MKKTFLLFSLFLSIALLASGCIQKQNNQETPAPTNKQIPPIINNEAENNQNTTNDPETLTENVKEFTLTAKNWEFEPAQINVNKDDTVKLKITSLDVKHGLAIPEFNIKADLNPNEETIVEFKADKSGTFTFFCSVYCGSGHKDMKGTLIVK